MRADGRKPDKGRFSPTKTLRNKPSRRDESGLFRPTPMPSTLPSTFQRAARLKGDLDGGRRSSPYSSKAYLRRWSCQSFPSLGILPLRSLGRGPLAGRDLPVERQGQAADPANGEHRRRRALGCVGTRT